MVGARDLRNAPKTSEVHPPAHAKVELLYARVTRMLARVASRVTRRSPVVKLKRSAHFATWPPSIPARPHPNSARSYSGDACLYGWGDWFFAHVISGFVAWPVVFATDMLWGDFLLPAAEKSVPDMAEGIAVLSLIPKVAASYFGAHLYLPQAWWLWKLTLLPAIPVGLAASLTIHLATNDGTHKEAIYDDWLPMKPEKPTSNCTAWVPSSSEEKSAVLRLREAAPSAVQQCLSKVQL